MGGVAPANDTGMTRRWVTWFWMWAGWTGLALFTAVSSSLAYISTGNPPRWSLTIQASLVDWYSWALIAPFVMALARRFPFSRATLGRSLAVHATASVILSIFKLIVDRVLRRWLLGFDTYIVITSLAPNFLVYWAIVAVAHGVTYYRTSRERELRASQLEARLAETRLQLLQMQLHPHFLFNTLHTISELVHEDPEMADRMITGLSDLLREALIAGDVREVPLRRELAVLDRYLEIQQARFGDRLRIDIDVDADVRDALVPHLILQPVVENAIRHGLGARVQAGRLQIQARHADGALLLRVQDDGEGLERGKAGAQEGVGLGNTRARLQELYGAAQRLDIQDAAGGGAVVTLRIPLHFEPR
jgi:two-component system, LytTR family, sensor kinase